MELTVSSIWIHFKPFIMLILLLNNFRISFFPSHFIGHWINSSILSNLIRSVSLKSALTFLTFAKTSRWDRMQCDVVLAVFVYIKNSLNYRVITQGFDPTTTVKLLINLVLTNAVLCNSELTAFLIFCLKYLQALYKK